MTSTSAAAEVFFDGAAAGWSDRYRDDPSFARRIDRILKAAAPLPADSTAVLDFGCGAGDLIAVLLSRGHRAVGVDVSQGMLERAEARTGLTVGEQLFRIDTAETRLPFPTEHFSLCVASSVLEYVPDPEITMREITRVLARGARFVATVPDPRHPARIREARFKFLLGLPLAARAMKRSRWAEGAAYLEISRNRFPLDHWVELANRAGLHAVASNPDSHPLALLVAEKP